MQLIILRHGEAEDHASSDRKRNLTAQGRKQANTVASFFQRKELIPDGSIVSPYIRTQQTADIVREQLGLPKSFIHYSDAILSGATPQHVCNTLLSYQERGVSLLLMVSHMPFVAALVALLVNGNSSHAYQYTFAPAEFYILESLCFTPNNARIVCHKNVTTT